MTQAQKNFKTFADRRRRKDPEFQVGDLVWLSTRHIKLHCPSKKLGQKFLGPFPIIQQINDVAFKLKLPASYKIHPVFHSALLKPVTKNSFPGRTIVPPSPVVVEGSEEFEVEAILDSRINRGRLQYLVQWKGYPPEENSWEPMSNIHAPQLTRLFHNDHPDKPTPSRVRRSRVGEGQCRDPVRSSNDARIRPNARRCGCTTGRVPRTDARRNWRCAHD
eukprot:XP_017947787.1 PREDICTED: chromodomain Y-like protein [Xenopus tropicalis]